MWGAALSAGDQRSGPGRTRRGRRRACGRPGSELPPIEMYLDMIKDMTLVQVAPQSGGAIDDAELKAIQADLDAIE